MIGAFFFRSLDVLRLSFLFFKFPHFPKFTKSSDLCQFPKFTKSSIFFHTGRAGHSCIAPTYPAAISTRVMCMYELQLGAGTAGCQIFTAAGSQELEANKCSGSWKSQ